MQTTIRVRQRVKGIFYGWWIVAAGFLIQLLNGALLMHSFTAYVVPLQAEFHWSRSLLAGAFSMARLEEGILGPIQGWLTDRLGPRSMMRVGLIIFGVGFILFSRMDSVLTFYLTFAMMAVGSSLGGMMPIVTTVVNWFSRRRSIAMGIAMSGMGVGGLLVPVVAWSLTSFDWRPTALVSGVIILAVGLPISQVMRHRPEQYGYLPDGDTLGDTAMQTSPAMSGAGRPSMAEAHTEHSFTAGQALRMPTFWLISIAHAQALIVVGAVSFHQIPHMVDDMGISLVTAGSVVAVLTMMNITGQWVGGFIGDRIDKRLVIAACLMIHAIALLIFAFGTTILEALIFAVLHGTAWGVRGPLIMSLRADYFGPRSYATIMGFSSLIMMMGMTTGPILAAVLADVTKGYEIPFVIIAAIAALGAIPILLARKPQLPT